MRDHIAGRRYFWSCSASDQAERVAKQRSDCGSLLRRMTLMLSGMSGSAERCARLLPRDDSARQRIWQGDLGVGSGGLRNDLPQKRGNPLPHYPAGNNNSAAPDCAFSSGGERGAESPLPAMLICSIARIGLRAPKDFGELLTEAALCVSRGDINNYK